MCEGSENCTIPKGTYMWTKYTLHSNIREW